MGISEFDVWNVKELDCGSKVEFLRTIEVDEDMNIQDLRKQIQSEIYPKIRTKIDLQIYKTEAVRKNETPIKVMMKGRAPHVVLSSDNNYTIKTVTDRIETSYGDNKELNKLFNLEQLPRMKIIACIHNET